MRRAFAWLLANDTHLYARWIFLRGLGVVFLVAFGSLSQQIHALLGPNGIAPAAEELASAKARLGWFAWLARPSLLWIDASTVALTLLVVVGLVASVALLANLYPRVALVACATLVISVSNAAPSFSRGDVLDGFLLETTLLAAAWAPAGSRPGLGVPSTRASHCLLLWLWFRLYFESGVAKLRTGDWWSADAMQTYFETIPSPTWIAWHAHRLPPFVYVLVGIITIAVEVPLPAIALVYPRARRLAFVLTTGLQLGILLTGNFAYLNWLAIVLGVVLLDDAMLRRARLVDVVRSERGAPPRSATAVLACTLALASIAAYAPWALPARILSRFGLGNRYALFGSIPRARWVVAIEGSVDGVEWKRYTLRYDSESPRFIAPYHPRLESALWLCSFESLEHCSLAPRLARALLHADPSTLTLFRDDPFQGAAPKQIRFVRYRYTFTSTRQEGWWHREVVDYGPTFGDWKSSSSSAT